MSPLPDTGALLVSSGALRVHPKTSARYGGGAAGRVLARIAGPVEGGWRIISVWESEEAFDTFRRERLEPALQQAGRPAPQLEIAPLHSVRLAPPQR